MQDEEHYEWYVKVVGVLLGLLGYVLPIVIAVALWLTSFSLGHKSLGAEEAGHYTLATLYLMRSALALLGAAGCIWLFFRFKRWIEE